MHDGSIKSCHMSQRELNELCAELDNQPRYEPPPERVVFVSSSETTDKPAKTNAAPSRPRHSGRYYGPMGRRNGKHRARFAA